MTVKLQFSQLESGLLLIPLSICGKRNFTKTFFISSHQCARCEKAFSAPLVMPVPVYFYVEHLHFSLKSRWNHFHCSLSTDTAKHCKTKAQNIRGHKGDFKPKCTRMQWHNCSVESGQDCRHSPEVPHISLSCFQGNTMTC